MEPHTYSGDYPPTTAELTGWLLKLVRAGLLDASSYLLRIVYSSDGTPFIKAISPRPSGEGQQALKPSRGWGLFQRRGRGAEARIGPIEGDEIALPDLSVPLAVAATLKLSGLPHPPADTATGLRPLRRYTIYGVVYETDANGEAHLPSEPEAKSPSRRPTPSSERRSSRDRRAGARPWRSIPRRQADRVSHR